MDQRDVLGMAQFEKSVAIGSDHAGFAAKEDLVSYLRKFGYKIEDVGCFNSDRVDYPDYANLLVKEVGNSCGFGILICGTGIGMSMASNRHSHIRAALCHNLDTVKMSREHNDANVLCLGSRQIDEGLMRRMVFVFLNTNFEGGRHDVRIKKF